MTERSSRLAPRFRVIALCRVLNVVLAVALLVFALRAYLAF